MTYDRRSHQKRAIADILAGFKRHTRGQFISACGTGKTLTSLWVKEDLDAQRTLVLVPSLALIDQYASEWRKHQAPDRRVATLCVCSDNTVGRQADEDDYDSLHFTADDLIHDGFDVTSSPDRIAAFMRQGSRQVIFSTYQSSHLIEAAQADDSVPTFDLAIADEAHRCAGDTNSLFAIILDGDRIRAEMRLFATATPKIYALKKGQEEAATDLVDMSDEARFGPCFHTLTMGESIRLHLLSDYQVAIMAIHNSDIQFAANDKNKEGRLSPERVKRLDAVGFIWSVRNTTQKAIIPALQITDRCIEDLVERPKDEQVADDIPEHLAQFGCDLEQSRVLVEKGSYDEADERHRRAPR